MPGPAYVEQTIWRGTSAPSLTWRFGPAAGPEMALTAFRLEVTWLGYRDGVVVRGGITVQQPADLVIDRVAGTITWFFSPAQGEAIPHGIVRHELIGSVGETVRLWAWGPIVLRSGAAHDEPVPPSEPAGPSDPDPDPGAGTARRYEHLQSSPAAVWTVPHNLGHRPIVEVLSLGGVRMIADIRHLSTLTLQVVLDDPMPGLAICL